MSHNSALEKVPLVCDQRITLEELGVRTSRGLQRVSADGESLGRLSHCQRARILEFNTESGRD